MAAEAAVRNYTYNPGLVLKQVDYVDMNDMTKVDNETRKSEHFKQEIYEEEAGVHIPIEIYEGCECQLRCQEYLLFMCLSVGASVGYSISCTPCHFVGCSVWIE